MHMYMYIYSIVPTSFPAPVASCQARCLLHFSSKGVHTELRQASSCCSSSACPRIHRESVAMAGS